MITFLQPFLGFCTQSVSLSLLINYVTHAQCSTKFTFQVREGVAKLQSRVYRAVLTTNINDMWTVQ